MNMIHPFPLYCRVESLASTRPSFFSCYRILYDPDGDFPSFAPAVSTNAAGRGNVWFVLSSHILWTRKRLLKYCCISACRIVPTNVFTSTLICVVAEQADARNTSQWRSQKAKNVTHIKGRLLDQAVILFNCVPFPYGNFSERNEFAPRGSEFFPLRAVPYGMENHLFMPH